MTGSGHSARRRCKTKIKHQIIDADGHWVEFPPVFAERMP
jgi:hypothetical protein